MAALTDPDDVLALVTASEDVAALAADFASDAIRSYCQTDFEERTTTLTLAGTPRRKLVVGSRVMAVTSVVVDGDEIPATEYRWHERGLLFRYSGWGTEVSTVEVAGTFGYAEVPAVIRAVATTAAARFASNPEGASYVAADGGYAVRWPDAAAGALTFSLGERAVLDRYRRRSWPSD